MAGMPTPLWPAFPLQVSIRLQSWALEPCASNSHWRDRPKIWWFDDLMLIKIVTCWWETRKNLHWFASIRSWISRQRLTFNVYILGTWGLKKSIYYFHFCHREKSFWGGKMFWLSVRALFLFQLKFCFSSFYLWKGWIWMLW